MSLSSTSKASSHCSRLLHRRCLILSSPSRCLRLSSSTTPSSSRRRDQKPLDSRRWSSTDASTSAAPIDPKISGIVDQIGQLTLLETADLVASLKSRLNIPDISFAPPSGGAASTPIVEEEEAAPAPAAKTLFSLKLESFEATSKPKVIKEIKSLLGLSLVDSKKFVESAPKIIKEGIPKDDVEKMQKVFEGLGAKVTVE